MAASLKHAELDVSMGWIRGLRWGAAGATVGVILAVLVLNGPAPASQPGLVPEGVTLMGIPVAGESADGVRIIAAELSERMLRHPLTVRCGTRTLATTPGNLGAAVDVEAAVKAALAPIVQPAGFFDRLRERFSRPEVPDVPLVLTVTEPALRRGLTRFAIRCGLESRDARLTKVNGKFVRTPARPGRELDFPAMATGLQGLLDAPELRRGLAESLDLTIDTGDWLKSRAPLSLTAPTRAAAPRIGEKELKPITARLASYSTGLGGSSRNRVHNVSLACAAIDGTVLLPGDVFSYNDVVGPRVPSAGFKEAPVIIRGELQPGLGGGICQVSSTLYNAILLADLQIVRRSHHAFPVHYLPAGQDATVVDGAIDFRFKNSLKYPVAIDAKATRGRVTFHVYGHPDEKRDVVLERSGISLVGAGMSTVADPRLPVGKRVVEKRARSGQRVTLTRIVRRDGVELRREVVSRDYYRPFDGIVRVGSRVADASPKKPGTPLGGSPLATTPGGPERPAPTTPAAAGTPPLAPGGTAGSR